LGVLLGRVNFKKKRENRVYAKLPVYVPLYDVERP
jgi:hypothetical protein